MSRLGAAALIAVSTVLVCPTQAQLTIVEGTAHAVPLDRQIHGQAVSQYRIADLPEQGVLSRMGVSLSVGVVFSVADLEMHPLVYRHTAIGDVASDSFELEASLGQEVSTVSISVVPQASPISSLSEVAIWLDASLASSVINGASQPAASGETIARWEDRAPGAHHANQATEAIRPIRVSSADSRGQLGATRFTGGQQTMISSAALSVSSEPVEFTYIASLNPSGVSTGLQGVFTANAARSGIFLSGTTILGRSFNSQQPNRWTAARIDPGEWLVVTSRVRADVVLGSELYVGGLAREVTHHIPELLGLQGSRVGDSVSSVDTAFDGLIGELVLISDAISWHDRNRIDYYLRSKWGSLVIHDLTSSADDHVILANGTTPVALFGGAGDDELRGSLGRDILIGGPGADVLFGGAGADRFVFESVINSSDRILDFSRDDADEIDLTGVIGEGAEYGFDEVIRIRVEGGDSIVEVDVDGTRAFESPEISLRIEDVNDISASDLITGLETSPSGLQQLELQWVGPAPPLELGVRQDLRLVGHYDDGSTREIVSRQVRYTASPRLAEIDHRGSLLPHRPGQTTVTAEFHGLHAVLENISVAATPHRSFWELGQVEPGTGDAGYYQGLAIEQDDIFTTANFETAPNVFEARIFKLNRQFEPLGENRLHPPGYGPSVHVGAIDSYQGFLWATFMDLETFGDPTADTLLGLAKIDPDSLELVGYQDLTGLYGYLDAICFDQDEIWLPTLPPSITRRPMSADGADTTRVIRHSYQGGIGALQGIRIHNGRVYTVPESTTSLPESIGISVFDKADLVEDLDAQLGLDPLDHASVVNVPLYNHPIRYPGVNPDHESIAFDPDELAVAYLPFIQGVPGGDTLIKLELERCPESNADADGDGLCADADCAIADAQLWRVPGPTAPLEFVDRDTLSWAEPSDPGTSAASLAYEVMRWTAPDQSEGFVCVENGEQLTATAGGSPPAGAAWFYLVRATNGCGAGSLGLSSDGAPRAHSDCST